MEKLLIGKTPDFLAQTKKCAVLFRHIATPNNETKHFLSMVKNTGLEPVICEYHDDIFTPDTNEYKHALTKVRIHKELQSAKHVFDKENITIVDFNKFRNKKISQVTTLWGEPLVSFHHNLFKHFFPQDQVIFWDASEWCQAHGKAPLEYYKSFFLFFIVHGIFFENFLFNKEELNFSKKVILPAIEEVVRIVGLKPLVVPIVSLEAENYYPYEIRELVKEKLKNKKCLTLKKPAHLTNRKNL